MAGELNNKSQCIFTNAGGKVSTGEVEVLNKRIEKLESELREKNDEIRGLNESLEKTDEFAFGLDDEIRTLREKGREMKQTIESLSRALEALDEREANNEAKLRDDIWEEDFDVKDRIRNLERLVGSLNTTVFESKVDHNVEGFFDE